jgi:hypothetical protein
MRTALLALLLALSAAPAAAQTAPDSTLRPFAFLVGQWQGPAWYMDRSGARVPILQTEVVRPAAGGRVLVIDGEGRAVDAAGNPGAVVFSAFAVLSYDPATGRHHIDAFTDGRHVRTEAVPAAEGQGFEWGFESGGRRVRYVMRLDEAGRWVETGHVQVAPERWVQFVELTVARQAEVP